MYVSLREKTSFQRAASCGWSAGSGRAGRPYCRRSRADALIWDNAPDEAKRAIMENGVWRRPSAYSSEPDCFTRALIEDGRKHLLLDGVIRTRAPTIVLQGMRDEDVPYTHALALMQRLSEPATLTLISDGDHRLSRPQDLQLIFDALDRLIRAKRLAAGGHRVGL